MNPAAGVIATRPATIPLMAPATLTFLKRRASHITQVQSAVAVQRWVLRMAAAASALAKYGSPPLKPLQPSQSRPPPATAMIRRSEEHTSELQSLTNLV